MAVEDYDPVREGMLDVPVDTFWAFLKFIAKHDLWDEVKEAVADAGVDVVPLDRRPIEIISALVASKGGGESTEPDHADALVTPECGCNVVVTHPDIHPTTPTGPGGDAGAGDAGSGGTHP